MTRRWCLVMLLALASGLCLGLFLLLAHGQTPGPTTAQLEERARATDRTLTIVRERELEMTRLVALYANRLEETQKELAQVRATCPAVPELPPNGEGGKP